MYADEAARTLDLLRARGRPILVRIAAARTLAPGRLHLVVEQSELARIAPLTYVSVQHDPDEGRPVILSLDSSEKELIGNDLFSGGLSERALYLANFHLGETLRMVSIETQAVSAHARLAAMMARAAG